MSLVAARRAALIILALGASVGALLSSGASGPAPHEPYVLVALGDSFTRAMDPGVGDQPDQSWATGSDPRVHSVLERIRASRPGAVGHNLARSGARMDDLVRQVDASRPSADEVLILMGINDACLLTDTLEFRTHAREGLAAVGARHPGAHVVVYAIPNLLQLGSVHAATSGASLLRSESSYCRHFFLPGLNPNGWNAEGRWAEYNSILREEAGRQGFEFSAWISEVRFTEGDVSPVDYFHPTWAGEARLAEAAWPSAVPRPSSPALSPLFLFQ